MGVFFACMFDDYLWKSYVYRTTFSNVKYQDLFEEILVSLRTKLVPG